MSIFPKRTLQGTQVTIHWNFNIAHLENIHVFPFVRIGVKAPDGKVTMLFEDHVLGLPDPPSLPEGEPDTRLKYLNKNLPLMIIASYLEGKASKERLVNILENIQSGRHYYFTFQVPEDAPLGKYTLISEVHSGGEIRHSKTKEDDFFFVEKVISKDFINKNGKTSITIFNKSPEPTPVKIVSCKKINDEKMETSLDVFEMQGNESRVIEITSSESFLLYNEEREHIPLHTISRNEFLLRNQNIYLLSKNSKHFLMKNTDSDAYELNDDSYKVWSKANGLIQKHQLSSEEQSICHEMVAEGLIDLIKFAD